MNRGKENSCYHYVNERTESLIKDELLEDVQVMKLSNFKAVKGSLSPESNQSDHYEDFIIEYIAHYLKEILATCDMSNDKLYVYESRLLKLLGFYLN